MKPGVSVIVPVLNAARSIRACLQSVLNSKGVIDGVEVICVDNGSTDGTLDVIREFGSDIRLLHENARGAAAARNAGLRAATRELTAFTDADCFVDPLWLARLLKPLRDRTAEGVGGRIRARPGAGAVERFGELIHDHQKAIEYFRPPYLITMNMAAATRYLHELGLFDERFLRMQDADLSMRMVAAGARMTYRHDAVVYHHNRDSLPALAREGFLHGYYRPAFFSVHGATIEAHRTSQLTQPQRKLQPVRLSDIQLQPWQAWLFWKIFITARHIGQRCGQARRSARTS